MAEAPTYDQPQPVEGLTARAVTVKGAAGLMGISERMLYNLIKQHEIPTIQIGRRRLIRVRTIDRWLRSRETTE